MGKAVEDQAEEHSIWEENPNMLLISFTSLSILLSIFASQFPHLKKENDNNNIYFKTSFKKKEVTFKENLAQWMIICAKYITGLQICEKRSLINNPIKIFT